MSTISNALLRHRVIDSCLRDTKNSYTLKDLINACLAAIKKKYGTGTKSGVSTRSLQLDLQFMRDPQKGYGAPIVVYNQKYYRYEDPNFTILNTKLGKENLNSLNEVADTLYDYAHFKDFSSLKEIADNVLREIDSYWGINNNIVCYEPKRNPLGMEYFEVIYDAIVNKKALCVGYFSSRSNNIMNIIFYPFYLKEYKGRWFALGYKDGLKGVYKLPLDRIRDYSYSILPFPDEYSFDPYEYFKDIIGVTKLSGEVKEIRYLVKNRLAPFIKKNPLHHSQKIEFLHENGDMEFTINIIPNREFYNVIFDYQPHIQIISPRDCGLAANGRVLELVELLPDYTIEKKVQETSDSDSFDNGFNLFSNL